jgi:hypothetical protein
MSDVWRQMETCGPLEQMPAVLWLLLIKIERWQSLAHLRRRWGGSEFSTGSNRFDPHWIVTDVFGPTGVARLAEPSSAAFTVGAAFCALIVGGSVIRTEPIKWQRIQPDRSGIC